MSTAQNNGYTSLIYSTVCIVYVPQYLSRCAVKDTKWNKRRQTCNMNSSAYPDMLRTLSALQLRTTVNVHNFSWSLGCSFKKQLPLIFLKLRRQMYFEALITNMIVKIGANLIFMVKPIKNPLKSWFFAFISVNKENFEEYLERKL